MSDLTVPHPKPGDVAPLIGEARERQRRRWRAFGAAALLAFAAVTLTLTSRQWGVPFGGGSSSGPLSRYSEYGFSFSYPAGWHAGSGWVAMGGLTGIVYLSTERLHPPCKTLHHANGDATGGRCGADLVLPGVLPPGGVLVQWTGHFGSFTGFSQRTGSLTRIGGHMARIVSNESDCSAWDADESITAYIAPGYQMDACMRGPRLGQLKAQVQAMLRSVSFQTPTR